MARRPPKTMADSGTPLGVVELRGDAGAVLGRRGEAAVGMRALDGSLHPLPFQGSPFQSRAFSGGFLSRPSHQTVLSSRLCTTLVKMVPFWVDSQRVGVGLLVGAGGDAEEAVLRVDGPQAAVLADAHPGDVVAHAPDLIALLAVDLGRDQHGQVGLAAGGREGGGDVLDLALRDSRCPG